MRTPSRRRSRLTIGDGRIPTRYPRRTEDALKAGFSTFSDRIGHAVLMRVLVVEDEVGLAETIRDGLAGQGFTADLCHDGVDGLWTATEAPHGAYDVVILDIMLPQLSGYEVCRRLRKRGIWTPVLMLTAKDGEYDQADALDLGADDYLTKPVDLAEVAARVRAVTRRARAVRSTPPLRHGPLQLDLARRSVTWRDEPVPVTDKEFGLLEAFVRGGQRVHPRAALQAAIYDLGEEASSNTIEVYVHFLRRKFGPRLIRTVRGSGYQIAPEESLRD